MTSDATTPPDVGAATMTSPPGDGEGLRQMRFAPSAGATQLLLIRHGESAEADPDRPFPLVDGHGDPPLHSEGRRQAELLAGRLTDEFNRGAPIDALYVTTLQRTSQTAAPTATALGLTMQVEADLREVHLGEWEGGELRRRTAQRDPVVVRMWQEQRWDLAPGAERLEVFDARVRAGFERIITTHPGERVVVVAHGGVIGHLLHVITGAERFAFAAIDNASISEVVGFEGRWVLRRFNDTAHLR